MKEVLKVKVNGNQFINSEFKGSVSAIQLQLQSDPHHPSGDGAESNQENIQTTSS